MNLREEIRRHVMVFSRSADFLQDLAGITLLSADRVSPRQSNQAHRIVSSASRRQPVLRDCLLIIAFGQVCAASTIVGGDGISLHLQCLVTLLDGTVILTSKVENPSGGDSGSR